MNADALRKSWRHVEELGDEAATTFYSFLFTADPRLRSMFPMGMSEQRDKLLKALGHIVANVDDIRLLSSFASQLGRDHRRFGVVAHHYQTVGRALMETLRRSLGPGWTPELAADWMRAYNFVAQLMINAADADGRVNPAAWPARVDAVERRGADLSVITVTPQYPYPYLAGQSCAVHHQSRPAVWRYLSPANAPRPDNTIEFHVRAIPGGQLSPMLTYQLRAGDVVTLGPPVGTVLAGWRRSGSELMLIAGGTGLAPLRSIVEQLTLDRYWSKRVTLVIGADTETDLYDMSAVNALESRASWLRVIPVVRRGRRWTGAVGTAADVALQASPHGTAEIYLCGSDAMVTTTVERLRAHGYDRRRVHVESFASTTYPPLAAANLHPEVIS
ncbi:globin domain-containing protein [Planosporangium mesophilum]|uniref:nitric oxide dioxygenase n=1 Tax=Planosporangium mesophilum TaxID=689768 RepID=A0A8J3TH36_9ACTN|nr:globin domain-containing protein [Planosporangium mesophilum]NJC85902.1 hypothetical protein [Planosporangium mesophilum]GII25047.1 flavohemoprotein [Planosporangium mesophilum]